MERQFEMHPHSFKHNIKFTYFYLSIELLFKVIPQQSLN
jgi:hypothetical protein